MQEYLSDHFRSEIPKPWIKKSINREHLKRVSLFTIALSELATCCLSEVDCETLFLSLEEHQQRHAIQGTAPITTLFRNLLAAFTLHCASRPRNELMAWTIRYADPVVSFFFGGDTEIGSVTGRFFDRNIKVDAKGEMHQELHRPHKPPHMSVVEFTGNDAESAVHEFYDQSEQRPARFFPLGGYRYALVSAHPDYDEGWFVNVDADVVQALPEMETLNLIETRSYNWFCGCSQEKIMEILVPIVKDNPKAIFGEESSAIVNCPRCGANYQILKEELTRKIENLH
jgi:molecular chaperone Hsp33